MDFALFMFFNAMFLIIGLCIGRWLHAWKLANEVANCGICNPEREPVTTTQGAAYDACLDEPTTDYDAEAVRRLLNY